MDERYWKDRMASSVDPAAGNDWSVGGKPLPSGRGVLSASEIDALLRPDLSDMDEPTAPTKVEQKPLPSLAEPDRNMETARQLTAGLSLALRRDCLVDAVMRPLGVRIAPFAVAAETAGPGGAAVCFAASTGTIAAMLVIDDEVAGQLVELACGGTASASSHAPRPLTAMGTDILQSVLSPAASAFGDGATLARVEPRASYAMALAPSGDARVIDVIVCLDGAERRATLLVSDTVEAQSHTPVPLPEAQAGVTAVLTARLASLSVPASRISRLKPGDTLLLGLPPDQPVSLLSGGRDGKVAAEGDIGRKGANMAIRLTRSMTRA